MPELDARVPCKAKTRDTLRALKDGPERYEDVLQRLIQEYEESTHAN